MRVSSRRLTVIRKPLFLLCIFAAFITGAGILSAGTAFAASIVYVQARGSAPVAQGIIQAKQVALMLAKRQAAEKAAGMSMDVQQTPGSRSIIEQSTAGLTYTVLSEHLSAGLYSVTIEAAVNVPDSGEGMTAGTAVLSVTQSATGDLIDTTPYGEVNWTQGYIIAYGRGIIPQGVNQDICDSMAKRAAMLDAHARALEIAQGLNIDGDSTVSRFVAKNSRLLYRLKGLIARVKPFDQEKENGFYTVKIKVPFYGINGIQVVFLRSYIKSDTAAVQPVPANHKIIIDARGTGLEPALFIKIRDQAGNVVYTAKDVGREALQIRGMVQYVTATTVQKDDIQARALKASGSKKGDVIISTPDAAEMMQKNNKNALATGNVVVITDSPVGGTEGSLLFMFAAVR